MTPVFSTAYLPPIDYMAALTRQTVVMMETKETFPKQTYRNRAVIMTANGVKTLSVPTIRSNHSRTDEVLISYKERWNIIHLRTLDAAYNASPYYQYYRDGIESILMQHYDRLVDLNDALLHLFLDFLKSDVKIIPTSTFEHFYTQDYRNAFSPKCTQPAKNYAKYYQVFSDRIPFAPNLSTIDLLMNMGPEAKDYLMKTT